MPEKRPSGGRMLSQKFIERVIITIEKMVLMPNFQPTMNPATKSSAALMMKTMLPTVISTPNNCRTAIDSTSERPAAPPPMPLAGMMQPIPAEKSKTNMPTVTQGNTP